MMKMDWKEFERSYGIMDWEEYKELGIKWNKKLKQFKCITCSLEPTKCKCDKNDRQRKV